MSGFTNDPSNTTNPTSDTKPTGRPAVDPGTQSHGDPVATSQRPLSYHWRPVDIAVTAVIGVVSGLIFWLVDLVITPLYTLLEGALPGLAGLTFGLWYFAGVLAIIIVRKPGAAFFAEVVAAALELTLDSHAFLPHVHEEPPAPLELKDVN